MDANQAIDYSSYGRKENEGKDLNEDTNFGKLKRIHMLLSISILSPTILPRSLKKSKYTPDYHSPKEGAI